MASDTAVSQLARRYAGALIDVSEAAGAVDAVAQDLAALNKALAESADLKTLINSPLIGRDDQKKAVLAVAKKSKLNTLTSNFLGVLAENRRLAELPAIITGFMAERDKRRGLMTAKVTSAVELSAVQQKAIAKALKGAHGVDIALETAVDPAIMGGLAVRLGSKMIDFSVRSKLERLELKLKGVA